MENYKKQVEVEYNNSTVQTCLLVLEIQRCFERFQRNMENYKKQVEVEYNNSIVQTPDINS